jgi:hypothetical protein
MRLQGNIAPWTGCQNREHTSPGTGAGSTRKGPGMADKHRRAHCRHSGSSGVGPRQPGRSMPPANSGAASNRSAWTGGRRKALRRLDAARGIFPQPRLALDRRELVDRRPGLGRERRSRGRRWQWRIEHQRQSPGARTQYPRPERGDAWRNPRARPLRYAPFCKGHEALIEAHMGLAT